MKQSQSEEPLAQSRDGINFLFLMCQSVGVTCEIFLHRGFGRRWPGVCGMYGLVVLVLFPLFWPPAEAGPLLCLLGAYIAACVLARICALCSGGNGAHSRYSGNPRIARLLPFLSESTIKRLIEPMLVFSIGVAMLGVNQPLGVYLILAAWGLFISTNVAEVWARSRAQDLQDAVMEQRDIAERFRRSNGNNW